MKNTRVEFKFDERSLEDTNKLREQGRLGHVGEGLESFYSRMLQRQRNIDMCQWADGRLGRAVQQTVNLEGE